MDKTAAIAPLLETLGTQTDEELRTLIESARSMLAARQGERRKQAALKIRELAKEHGLTIAVRQPARKRGRPRKSGAASP
jgi:hypothetical protein